MILSMHSHYTFRCGIFVCICSFHHNIYLVHVCLQQSAYWSRVVGPNHHSNCLSPLNLRPPPPPPPPKKMSYCRYSIVFGFLLLENFLREHAQTPWTMIVQVGGLPPCPSSSPSHKLLNTAHLRNVVCAYAHLLL